MTSDLTRPEHDVFDPVTDVTTRPTKNDKISKQKLRSAPCLQTRSTRSLGTEFAGGMQKAADEQKYFIRIQKGKAKQGCYLCLGLKAKIFGLGFEAQVIRIGFGLATQGLGHGLVRRGLVNIPKAK